MKEDVDTFERGMEFSNCKLELQWTGGEQIQQLSHKVTISGVERPTFFYIRYPQHAGILYITEKVFVIIPI